MATTAEAEGTTDRIEQQFEVRAPLSRVWTALSDAREFGAWFQVGLDGPFVPGSTVRGNVLVPGYEHLEVEIFVESVQPETYFAYRWHPYPADPSIDYSAEPTTLVEFRLEETADGTSVTITESGFDRLPATRRAEAFRMNESGWRGQSRNLAEYVVA